MGSKANIIELNGKRYDARTGALLDVAAGSKASAVKTSRFVDGFARPKSAALAPHPAHKATPIPKPSPSPKPFKPVMDVSRPAAAKLRRHAPKKSQTLMRSVVKKPAPASLKRHTKVVSRSDALIQQPKLALSTKLSHPTVDPKRRQRAQMVPRSAQIRRYALTMEGSRGLASAVTPSTTTPTPSASHAHLRPVYASTTATVNTVQAPVAASMDVFERALQRANSHKQPMVDTRTKYNRRRSKLPQRILSFAAASLAVVLLMGFIAYQNQANLTIRYASSKAGFTASLPSYRPDGYVPKGFSYSSGMVGINYKNASSGQGFNLIEKQSNWDSSALLDDFVAVRNSSYKTVEAAGQTIYTYGDNNATWVSGGIWYQVNSAGALTTSELVNLATSM